MELGNWEPAKSWENNKEMPRKENSITNLCTVKKSWDDSLKNSAGIEKHKQDNVFFSIYSPEKTIADCFKFRNKIGTDIAIEALHLYRERRKMKIDDIMHFASICRVANIIRPYLEAIIWWKKLERIWQLQFTSDS